MRDIFRTNVPTHLKGKAFNQFILTVLTYGTEMLTLKKIENINLNDNESPEKEVPIKLGITDTSQECVKTDVLRG